MTATVFVTITLADADHWPALSQAASAFGASAAVLQGDGPGLCARLDDLACQGVDEVLLVGATFGDGGVPASWIGRVARWWLARRPDQPMSIRLLSQPIRGLPVGMPDPAGARLLRPYGEGLTSPAWQEPPPVRRHVLVCRGPRCTAKGAEALLSSLGAALHRRGLLDDEVLLTQTGCLFPCNRAPVVVVQPDMAWLGPVGLKQVAALVDGFAAGVSHQHDDEHLGGDDAEEHREGVHGGVAQRGRVGITE